MNCALEHIIEGKMERRLEVTWRSRRKQELDDFREFERILETETENCRPHYV